MLLYVAGAVCSLVVFQTGLTRSVDVSLEDLIAEIKPSIESTHNTPSLDSWARQATAKGTLILATVQLYDSGGRFIEEYGPPGVRKLYNGNLHRSSNGIIESMRSMYAEIGKTGYLQLQVSMNAHDEAVNQFGLAVLVIAPLLAAGVGVSAYLFSGKAVEPIERTNLLLRRFVTDAGHELKTPVAIIEACLQTLADPSKLGDMSEEVFDMLQRASDRLQHLARDLVVLARVEDPESEFSRTSLKLRDVIESVVAELSSAAASRSIDVSLRSFPDVSIEAHEESIHEILNNLIDNAIKYSENNQEVTISGSKTDQWVTISVSDSGVGIETDELSHIFDRFYRVDKSRSREVGGSGLGLSIVKAAVDRHGGRISVDSKPGKGSTFTVTLPL